MAAELVKRNRTQDGRTHAIVEVRGDDGRVRRWHVTIKPLTDFNNRPFGARYWIRPDGEAADVDAALAAAMADIERLAAHLPTLTNR